MSAPATKPAAKPETVRRFGKLFIVQHIVLFTSVLLLIASGVPLKFPNSSVARFVIWLQGGMEARALIHHMAGLVLISLGIFHIAYYVVLKLHPPFWKRPMMLQTKDATDLVQHMKYNVGLRPDLPKMGRYTWYEKMDYFGLMWGFVVMGLTGLAMLYMEQALAFIPLSWLQAMWAVHSEEAMLATLFLLIIHMYNVNFNPEKFPLSLTWLTGRITREEQEKYHPLEKVPEDEESFPPQDATPPASPLAAPPLAPPPGGSAAAPADDPTQGPGPVAPPKPEET